jgi:spectinomycin phosphotransferase
MLALLHQSPASAHTPVRTHFEVPGRHEFDAALADLGRRWDGGPLSDAARRELTLNAATIAGLLADLDRLASRLGAPDAGAVVTHGEPHPGNLIRTATGLKLVDWDTVARARPERDLWMIIDSSPAQLATYQRLTGTALDRDALRAYRLLWALADVAAFTAQLRAEHRRDADTEKALAGLRSILEGREPRPFG